MYLVTWYLHNPDVNETTGVHVLKLLNKFREMFSRVAKFMGCDGHSMQLEFDRENAYKITEEASWKRDIRKIEKEVGDNSELNGREIIGEDVKLTELVQNRIQ